MRCFREFWGVSGGAVLFSTALGGNFASQQRPGCRLVISGCAPPGSAAGRSLEYTTRGEKGLIMRNYDIFPLSCFCHLLGTSELIMKS
ncbi:hypothetical protein TRIATDRAFT_297742 [Trichoderma atroviride IMI 206040]|uniref:Uncharacterized protein n=1 Tax=Hypocrea atroviridis (strain ATCC 20476 / IMI 206040) TaxID=452589 RepID=G9NJD2_HYPAI|nr:uncharacterized protein TRIATDRAFT_297742 [Trichoderma atroviride IMI 206040]EHK49006.1 hypothetical protein TRIATDRAFT_297742 [Trichoderma atroviride IMI 206040]